MTHEFKIALAEAYGIEEAILIHNFHYWITENKVNNRNFFDGRFWTYNSQKAYADWFPYFNAGKIKRTINSLIEKGILMKGNHNANQYDRTNWYAFTDKGLSIVQKCYIDWSKMANGRVENGRPIPDNIPNSNNIIFTPSGDETDAGLFDDTETSTMTMLSSEKLPYEAEALPAEKADCFEDLWLMYERKGSKAKAKKEFEKLSSQEVDTIRLHIPAYLESRPERQYRLDFERYLKNKAFTSVVYSKSNVMLFDPEAPNTSSTTENLPVFTDDNATITINGVKYR